MEDRYNLQLEYESDMLEESRESFRDYYMNDINMFVDFLKEDPFLIFDDEEVEKLFKGWLPDEDYDSSDVNNFIDEYSEELFNILSDKKDWWNNYMGYLDDLHDEQ